MTALSDISDRGLVDYSRPTPTRHTEWCRLYREGFTARQIGDLYGVSSERVCQILRPTGLIEQKEQRRELAKELIEQDRAAVLADRAELAQKIVALVKSGKSITTAAAEIGITSYTATYICAKHGLTSQHGRWRDFSARAERLRSLVAAGHSLAKALKIAGAEEGRIIAYQWAVRHVPELQNKRQPNIPPTERV